MADTITYVDVTNSKSTFDGQDLIVVQDKSAAASGATEAQKFAAMQKTTLALLKLFNQAGLTLAMDYTGSQLNLSLKNASGTTLSTQSVTISPGAHTHTKSQITDFAHNHPTSEITDFPGTFTMTATLATGGTKTLTIYGSEG